MRNLGRGVGVTGSRGVNSGQPPSKFARSHTDLEVYQIAFETAMTIFELSKAFPAEEGYSLTDQIRRSSRAVCANIAEAWRRRRYEKSFVLRLNDAEAEAAETQTWLEFAVKCGYVESQKAQQLYKTYNNIIGKVITMINQADSWTLKGKK